MSKRPTPSPRGGGGLATPKRQKKKKKKNKNKNKNKQTNKKWVLGFWGWPDHSQGLRGGSTTPQKLWYESVNGPKPIFPFFLIN
jgi:hypothetical protein